MDTLKLVLKRYYFDMITKGNKREEYREITPYWAARLSLISKTGAGRDLEGPQLVNLMREYSATYMLKWWNRVTFYMGYAKSRPQATYAVEAITVGMGRPEWGAVPGKEYFIIKFREI